MNIVGRAGWGAVAPRKPLSYVAPSKRRYFVVHHSGAPSSQSVSAIQSWCINGRGFNDIDYNFLVRGTTGEIYEGRGWDAVGAHTTNFNTTGVGICIIGNDELSDAAKASVRWLYEQYTKRCGRPLEIKGHRQLATTGTVCPGDDVFAWVAAGMPAPAGADVGDNVTVSEADAKRIAAAVWAHRFKSDSTAKRWPEAPEKSMAAFVALAAIYSFDLRRDTQTPVDVSVLASSLLRRLSEADRLALVSALSV